MSGYMPYDAHLARLDEHRVRADTHRRTRLATVAVTGGEPAAFESIAIRCAAEHDRAILQRLATLDSVAARPGEMLSAEVDGEPVAAVHVASGELIADPFRDTTAVAELLRLRAERLRDPAPATRRAPRLRAWARAARRAVA
jgi:hypothetical protein